MIEQRLIRFVGSVQGVGFRFTAIRCAAEFQITGTVRNCPDGSVECVAEGEQDEIDAFVSSLSQRMGRNIHNTTQQTAPAGGHWRSFEVVY